jgi:hypothetical protein
LVSCQKANSLASRIFAADAGLRLTPDLKHTGVFDYHADGRKVWKRGEHLSRRIDTRKRHESGDTIS